MIDMQETPTLLFSDKKIEPREGCVYVTIGKRVFYLEDSEAAPMFVSTWLEGEDQTHEANFTEAKTNSVKLLEELQNVHDYLQEEINRVWTYQNIPDEAVNHVEKAYKNAMRLICPLVNCEYIKEENRN
jgi:hypothetical protein